MKTSVISVGQVTCEQASSRAARHALGAKQSADRIFEQTARAYTALCAACPAKGSQTP